jgi:protein-tyrosine-phosphatase
MPKILFVCTANICRSPMAGALFRLIVDEKGVGENWQIETAGTWGREGMAASEGAQAVMLRSGIDLGSHRSRIIDRGIIEKADLVLTMERGHKEALQVEYPDLAGRIYLLSEMAGESAEISDPIGGPLSGYEDTAQEIERILREGFHRIERLAGSSDLESC